MYLPKFIIKRLFFALLTVWFVATLTFFLMHKLPGDPFASGKMLPGQIVNNLKAKYDFDKPLYTQYIKYMSNLIKGDFGTSMVYKNRSVNSIISRTFPVSADLGIRTFILSVFIGLSLGIIAALKHNGVIDRSSLVLSILGISLPAFVTGTLIQYFLCFKFSSFIQYLFGTDSNILPVTGWGGFKYAIAPVIALGFGTIGIIIRMMRSGMLEAMEQNYIITARAKGLDNKEIVLKHVLKNAVLPVMTLMSPMITAIIMGSFVVENIFLIPGMGRYFIESVQAKDYTMIMGLSVFTVSVIVILNLFFDIIYSLLDPRLRLMDKRN